MKKEPLSLAKETLLELFEEIRDRLESIEEKLEHLTDHLPSRLFESLDEY